MPPFFVPVSLSGVGFSPFHFRFPGATFWEPNPNQTASSPIHNSSGTVVANRAFAYPYFEGRGGTVDAFGAFFSVAFGGTLRIGIYDTKNNNGIPFPNSLLLSVDLTPGAATGTVASVLASPLQLNANSLYWLCTMVSAIPPGTRVISNSDIINYFDSSAIRNGVAAPYLYFTDLGGFNPLPNPFPAGASTSTSSNVAPLVAVRYSA